MGYYLDFIFDEQGITHEEVMKRFMDQGATVIEEMYYDKNHSGSPKGFYKTHVPMEYDKPDLYIPIFDVSKTESKTQKGCWADVRLSWAMGPDNFYQFLKNLIAFADRVGCRVYDGQIKEFLKSDNLKKALASFFGGAKWVTGNIGKIE